MNAIVSDLVEQHGLTEEEAKAKLSGWGFIPIMSSGDEIGHIAIKGNEVHTALYKKHRNKGIPVVRTYRNLLRKMFFLVTRVHKEDYASQAIARRVGFVEIHRQDDMIFYWMDDSTILGAKKCQYSQQ